MIRELQCLRCGASMEFLGREKLQLGEYGAFMGHFSNLVNGAMELDVCTCPECGKVEFFRPMFTKGEPAKYTDPELPQSQCPNCGNHHDFDFPKCPYCGFEYHG